MGKLFYLMGKSATGKDTLYDLLLARPELGLRPLVIYTTRPIRANETDGVQYHFVDEERLRKLEAAGRVIEVRRYDTVQGPWYYFTADTEAVDLVSHNYLGLGTLVSYEKVRDYYGSEKVIPIYVEISDETRLLRAMKREKKQAVPDYKEMCRRFLADEADFSEENITKAGVTQRFSNEGEREACAGEVAEYIRLKMC